jgi:hypothetical protein
MDESAGQKLAQNAADIRAEGGDWVIREGEDLRDLPPQNLGDAAAVPARRCEDVGVQAASLDSAPPEMLPRSATHEVSKKLRLRQKMWNLCKRLANENNSRSDLPPNLGFATLLSAEKRQAAKMALLGAEYIAHAGKLPPEFAAIATKTLLDVQQPPSQTATVAAKPEVSSVPL